MKPDDQAPISQEMPAELLVEELKRAKDAGESAYALSDRTISGNLDLSNRTVEIALNIKHCHFLEEVDLSYCDFKQTVDFSRCTFDKLFLTGDENRSHTIFRKDLICNESTFMKAARFRGVRCEGKGLFRKASFQGRADFGGASFEEALDCDGAEFRRGAKFDLLHCGVASFSNATFYHPEKLVDFVRASFRHLDCSRATFCGPVSFNGAECSGTALFEEARFQNNTPSLDSVDASADFTAATLKYLYCSRAAFKGSVSFANVHCGNDAVFAEATFLKDRCGYPGSAETAEIENAVNLRFARFDSSLVLAGATFDGEVWLEQANVSNTLDLRGACFQASASLYSTSIKRLEFETPVFERGLDMRDCTFEWLGTTAPPKTQEEDLLQAQRPSTFSRDPYRQLEQLYDRIGEEAEARRIYREGRRAEREIARKQNTSITWSWQQNLSDWLLKWLTGYGVQSWRLFILAGFFVVAGTLIFWSDASLKATASAPSTAAGGTQVAGGAHGGGQSSQDWEPKWFYRPLYSLDLFLPVVDLGVEGDWEPQGGVPESYARAQALVGWLLVPLLLTSVAGLVRR
jgi:uncharacterized protein YjbI with pentapeptide repeats